MHLAVTVRIPQWSLQISMQIRRHVPSGYQSHLLMQNLQVLAAALRQERKAADRTDWSFPG